MNQIAQNAYKCAILIRGPPRITSDISVATGLLQLFARVYGIHR
jgi:hypothetical protein